MDDATSPPQASSTVGCGAPKQKSSRSSTKPFKPKSPTLLQPTASYLAKLNRFTESRSQPIKTTEVKSPLPKGKVTKAKGPYLRTAERAERHRSKNVEQLGNNVVSNCRTFKALPLSKKVSNPLTPESGSVNYSKTNSTISSKQEEPKAVHKFKARPLNKKIFTSKGEMGVPRSTKREVTKPKEFKFLSDKIVAQNPPIELFKKMMNGVKEKSTRCGLKQSQFGGRKSVTGIGNRHNFSRTLEVR